MLNSTHKLMVDSVKHRLPSPPTEYSTWLALFNELFKQHGMRMFAENIRIDVMLNPVPEVLTEEDARTTRVMYATVYTKEVVIKAMMELLIKMPTFVLSLGEKNIKYTHKGMQALASIDRIDHEIYYRYGNSNEMKDIDTIGALLHELKTNYILNDD